MCRCAGFFEEGLPLPEKPCLTGRPSASVLSMRMIHFRIIGAIWLLSCLVPAVTHPFELWAVATGRPNSIVGGPHGTVFWISQILIEASFLFVLWMGIGLFRRRHWAVVSSRFVAVITVIVCLWFNYLSGAAAWSTTLCRVLVRRRLRAVYAFCGVDTRALPASHLTARRLVYQRILTDMLLSKRWSRRLNVVSNNCAPKTKGK